LRLTVRPHTDIDRSDTDQITVSQHGTLHERPVDLDSSWAGSSDFEGIFVPANSAMHDADAVFVDPNVVRLMTSDG
jgi:hypothetical protein